MHDNIDIAINKQLNEIIIFEEDEKFYRNFQTISVFDIFRTIKFQNSKKNIFCREIIKELKKTIPNIDDVVFIKDKDEESIIIGVNISFGTLKRTVYFKYNSKNNGLSTYSCTISYDDAKPILLKQNKEYYKELANFGIKNNLNDNLILPTISNDFRIDFNDKKFSIEMKSKLIELMDKYVYLHYYYNQDNIFNKITTEEGIFNLSTNVTGLEGLLGSNIEIKDLKLTTNNELNSTLRFLQNLKVYKRDIPEYLKEEIQKVKVLKK